MKIFQIQIKDLYIKKVGWLNILGNDPFKFEICKKKEATVLRGQETFDYVKKKLGQYDNIKIVKIDEKFAIFF